MQVKCPNSFVSSSDQTTVQSKLPTHCHLLQQPHSWSVHALRQLGGKCNYFIVTIDSTDWYTARNHVTSNMSKYLTSTTSTFNQHYIYCVHVRFNIEMIMTMLNDLSSWYTLLHPHDTFALLHWAIYWISDTNWYLPIKDCLFSPNCQLTNSENILGNW